MFPRDLNLFLVTLSMFLALTSDSRSHPIPQSPHVPDEVLGAARILPLRRRLRSERKRAAKEATSLSSGGVGVEGEQSGGVFARDAQAGQSGDDKARGEEEKRARHVANWTYESVSYRDEGKGDGDEDLVDDDPVLGSEGGEKSGGSDGEQDGAVRARGTCVLGDFNESVFACRSGLASGEGADAALSLPPPSCSKRSHSGA